MTVYTVWYSSTNRVNVLWGIFSTYRYARMAEKQIRESIDGSNKLIGELENTWIVKDILL